MVLRSTELYKLGAFSVCGETLTLVLHMLLCVYKQISVKHTVCVVARLHKGSNEGSGLFRSSIMVLHQKFCSLKLNTTEQGLKANETMQDHL